MTDMCSLLRSGTLSTVASVPQIILCSGDGEAVFLTKQCPKPQQELFKHPLSIRHIARSWDTQPPPSGAHNLFG